MSALFKLFGCPIYPYGLLLALACLIVTSGSIVRAKKYRIRADIIIALLALSGCVGSIGAKALYLMVSVPYEVMCEAVADSEWYQLLEESGQIFFGGALGGVLGFFLGIRVFRLKSQPCVRIVVPMVPLGHAIGRIGCLLAGCCYGKEYSGIGCITYRHAIGGAPVGISLFPVQAVEAAGNLLICLCLIWLDLLYKGRYLATIYVAMYSVLRFNLEYQRGDAIRGTAFGLSTSQWISLVILSCVVILWIARLYLKRRNGNYGTVKENQ